MCCFVVYGGVLNMSDKKTSLVICFTPLQMLIAEKIVAQQPSVDLIVIALNNNDKYKYYYNIFQHPNIAKQYYLFDNNKSRFFKFINIIKFNENFKLEKFYENIYISSIDNKYTHNILSKVNFNNLYTYDDGTANIVKNSIYFKQTFESKLKDIDKNFDTLALKKLLVMEEVNYHFKHPRETDEAFFEEIKTSYIFEDFFAKELSKYRKVIIYTLSSTAALNIISLDNVEIRLIKNNTVEIKYPDLVQLFIKSGATVIDMDSIK